MNKIRKPEQAKREDSGSSLFHLNFGTLLLSLVVLIALAFLSTSLNANLSYATGVQINASGQTTLTIVGLPKGTQIPVRFAPNFTTVTYNAINYTTVIP